jgi:hypothetical protein
LRRNRVYPISALSALNDWSKLEHPTSTERSDRVSDAGETPVNRKTVGHCHESRPSHFPRAQVSEESPSPDFAAPKGGACAERRYRNPRPMNSVATSPFAGTGDPL